MQLCELKKNHSGVVTFAEVLWYHFVIQSIPGCTSTFISCRIEKDDLLDGERHAGRTYKDLKDKKNEINQKAKEEMRCSLYRANAILKAENLARDALCIRT